LRVKIIILLIFLAGKPTNKMASTSNQTNLKAMIEMVIHELCIAQEKIAEIHSTIYEEIHPRINQALQALMT